MPFKALEQHFGHERTLSILDAVRGHSNEAVEVSHPIFAALRCAWSCVIDACTLALLAGVMLSPPASVLPQPTDPGFVQPVLHRLAHVQAIVFSISCSAMVSKHKRGQGTTCEQSAVDPQSAAACVATHLKWVCSGVPV